MIALTVDLRWHNTFVLPLQRVLREIRSNEFSTELLPHPMRLLIEWRGHVQPRGFGERDRIHLEDEYVWIGLREDCLLSS